MTHITMTVQWKKSSPYDVDITASQGDKGTLFDTCVNIAAMDDIINHLAALSYNHDVIPVTKEHSAYVPFFVYTTLGDKGVDDMLGALCCIKHKMCAFSDDVVDDYYTITMTQKGIQNIVHQ